MPYIIIRKTRRERDEALRESRPKSALRNVEGITRTTEEAFEIQRQREREGVAFDRPYAVSAAAPESKQAEAETLLRAGINPETMQSLQSESTKHG